MPTLEAQPIIVVQADRRRSWGSVALWAVIAVALSVCLGACLCVGIVYLPALLG